MEKVQVEEKNVVDPNATTKEETAQQAKDTPDQMQESLKTINEEALQLSEFVWQENKLIKELCLQLKQVLKQLSMSFGLPPTVFPVNGRTQRIILNEEAHLVLINEKNEVTSKALEDLPPQVIFDVVSLVVPELGKSLTSFRRKICNRVSLFDRVNQELKNLSNVFLTDSRPEGGNKPTNDAVKKALLSQHEGHTNT